MPPQKRAADPGRVTDRTDVWHRVFAFMNTIATKHVDDNYSHLKPLLRSTFMSAVFSSSARLRVRLLTPLTRSTMLLWRLLAAPSGRRTRLLINPPWSCLRLRSKAVQIRVCRNQQVLHYQGNEHGNRAVFIRFGGRRNPVSVVTRQMMEDRGMQRRPMPCKAHRVFP